MDTQKAATTATGKTPDDLTVFLADSPCQVPQVLVCTETQNVYVLEGGDTALHELLSTHSSAYVLDGDVYAKVEKRMTMEAWDSFGYEQIVSEVSGLYDILDVHPWGAEQFTQWYWGACADARNYPEWSGPDVSFPSVHHPTREWLSLDAEDALWQWVDNFLWAAVGGRSETAELALLFLGMGHGITPREALVTIIEHANFCVRTAGEAGWKQPPGTDWTSVRRYNAAPFPESSWYAKHLIETGAGGLF